MHVPRHFQMGEIPMENWILVNFLYRFNMLLTEAGKGGIYSNKTMFINVLVKWFKKTIVHMLSIKLSISRFQIVKPSDVLFYIFALVFIIRHVSETKLRL
jgi:hypothetical protein